MENIVIDMEMGGKQYRQTVTFEDDMTNEQKIILAERAGDCLRLTIIHTNKLYEVNE